MGDDSDDDVVDKQKQTKTQKKKEERKITEKAPEVKVIKINQTKMAEGGFEVTNDQDRGAARQERGRGGRGGRGGEGGEYRGRGGEGRGRGGRGRGGGDRPRTGYKLDADGNKVQFQERGPPGKFEGKPRENWHPFDKESGAGRGRRPTDRKGGAGKFNTGERPDRAYKRKGEDGEAEPKAEGAPADGEEAKGEDAPVEVEEEKKEEKPKEEVIEEIIGYSLDDFRKTKNYGDKK